MASSWKPPFEGASNEHYSKYFGREIKENYDPFLIEEGNLSGAIIFFVISFVQEQIVHFVMKFPSGGVSSK